MTRYPAWLVAILALLSGCAAFQRVGDPDADARAAQLVWRAWGRTDAVPAVTWFKPEALPRALQCKTLNGTIGLRRPDGRCIHGNTWFTLDGIAGALVAVPSDGKHSSSVLAHELLHVARIRDLAPWPHHAGEMGLRVCDAPNADQAWCVPRSREDRFEIETRWGDEALLAAGM